MPTRPWQKPQTGVLAALVAVLLYSVPLSATAEPKKLTLINVQLEGTKIWLPSSLTVQTGDEVELTLINKLDDPHGFKLDAFGIEEVVQPKAQMTVKFTAAKAGTHHYICQMHPPHLGGNLFIFDK